MKALIISIASIAVIIAAWWIFTDYAGSRIDGLIGDIDGRIRPSIEAGNWDEASEQIGELSGKWQEQKKVYTIFFDTTELIAAEHSIAVAESYIKEQDPALSAGELSLLAEQLKYLHANELISLDNIF